MKDINQDFSEEIEKMDDDEKLDFAFHEMEMLYKSRCVDVPLTSNVKVVDVEEKKKDDENSEK